MPPLFTAFIILALVVTGALDAQDAMLLQSWTASDGQVTQATFVKLDGESVVFEKDGKQFSVPLAKLNAASVALAERLSLQVTAQPRDVMRFVIIPPGEFIMGNTFGDDSHNERPHQVRVSAFRMQTTEVTKAQWDAVREWGLKHGYDDIPKGGGKMANHPVVMLTWLPVVMWCNAKSEMEGLTPCYYEDTAHAVVFKTGTPALDNTMVMWNANGYRLPTEAEWEKAARGGLIAKRFPWGDIISHAQANFNNKREAFSNSDFVGFHPTYKTGAPPYTSPVGSFAANGYGLYDMAGNVMEWCWDWYAPYPQDLQTDPHGRDTGYNRVFRGGSWGSCASNCNVSGRFIGMPHGGSNGVGFRLARR